MLKKSDYKNQKPFISRLKRNSKNYLLRLKGNLYRMIVAPTTKSLISIKISVTKNIFCEQLTQKSLNQANRSLFTLNEKYSFIK